MDYNARFQTNFSTDGDNFQNYYKDLSDRMKHREVDLLIVVNMFLTGFDDYYHGYEDEKGKHHKGYEELAAELKEKFPLTAGAPKGEATQKEFVKVFGSILRIRNILMAFDAFRADDPLLSPCD